MTTDTEAAAPKTHSWRGQLLQLAAIVLAVFIAKGAFAEPFYVPSGSMEPTLLIGDALLASKFPYGYGSASLPMTLLRVSRSSSAFERPSRPPKPSSLYWPSVAAGVRTAMGVSSSR